MSPKGEPLWITEARMPILALTVAIDAHASVVTDDD